jgi:hypothetical protein
MRASLVFGAPAPNGVAATGDSFVFDAFNVNTVENIYGSAGMDTLTGDDRDNEIRGGDSNDTIYGGAGNDTLNGQVGDDLVEGGTGNDILYGFAGNDTLRGQGDDDYLAGFDGVDTLEGGDGNDVVQGGALGDIMDGGNGIDTLDYTNAGSVVLVDLAASGLATGTDALLDTWAGFENLNGTTFGDTLTGDGFANAIFGNAGDDTISGGSGNDVLIGGAGTDTLDGGDNMDYLIGGEINNGGNNADFIVLLDGTTSVSNGQSGFDTYIVATTFDKGLDNAFAITGTVQYDDNIDKIDLSDLRDSGGNVLDLADVIAASSVVGGNIVINFATPGFEFQTAGLQPITGTLTLDGPGALVLGDLDLSDFVFSGGVNWEGQLPPGLPAEIG